MQTVKINTNLQPDQFALSTNRPPGHRFGGGKMSTAIPAGGRSNSRINFKPSGRGPFTADVDTGGNFIVPPR